MLLDGKAKISIFFVVMIALILVVMEVIVRAGHFMFPDSNLRNLVLLWHQYGIMASYNEAASFVRLYRIGNPPMSASTDSIRLRYRLKSPKTQGELCLSAVRPLLIPVL
jgi:hypothetical protein